MINKVDVCEFRSMIDKINSDSTKFYSFYCYGYIKEYYSKTITPAPIVIIEYIILIFKFVFLCSKKKSETSNCFGNLCFCCYIL